MTIAASPGRGAIGTLRERHLHASLKRWYAQPGDAVEVPVDGYVIDLVRDDRLIEIQTRGFSSARHKVVALLERGHRVRIVHPILVDTWIVKVDDDGQLLGRRRSPRHGQPTDAFRELVALAAVLGHPGLELDLVLTGIEELRRHTPDGPWRRRGWSVVERRLVDVTGTVEIRGRADLAALLPDDLPEPFTTADLSAGLGCSPRAGREMAYCLRHVGAIVVDGKRGHAVAYRIAPLGSG